MHGEYIHQDLKALGGVSGLHIEEQEFRVSDDSVLHIATAEGLTSDWKDKEELLHNIAKR